MSYQEVAETAAKYAQKYAQKIMDMQPVYDAAMNYERVWKAVYEDGTEEPRELALAAENLVYVCRRAKEGM